MHIGIWQLKRAHSLPINFWRIGTLLCAACALNACAPMVASAPVDFTPIAAASADKSNNLQLRAPADLALPTGYSRSLAAGSRWRLVGRIPQGAVYRPVDSVFSIEGRQVHEAYLVVDRHAALQGFYLPGEARYSPLDKPVQLSTTGELQ
ncbi:hypothetical protein [Variovorax soli]|mgnify:CR=1 FL=1|uniref:hypothetical protein n=1 Tax=Variovorax soli TaxID=376815 RepID=UPI00277D13C1|nr:hypothetical protein [Variovorax soli]